MKRIFILTIGLLCAFVAEAADSIEWFPNDTLMTEDLRTLEHLQRLIQFDDGHGYLHTGMGFPVSGSKILTAAHLFPHGKVGDMVRIGAYEQIGSRISWENGAIAQLDQRSDFAIIEFAIHHESETSFIPECLEEPSPGTQVIVYKPTVENDVVTSSSTFSAVVTRLRSMPMIAETADGERAPGTYSMRAQKGLSRLVAAGSGSPGVSGGAVWDSKRKCVAGIASAVIPFDSLEDRQATLEQAGNPSSSSFLIGAPIQH